MGFNIAEMSPSDYGTASTAYPIYRVCSFSDPRRYATTSTSFIPTIRGSHSEKSTSDVNVQV